MLMDVCANGHNSFLKTLLVDHGLDPNTRGKYYGADCTLLTTACEHDMPSTVRLLLEHGADPNLAAGKIPWTRGPRPPGPGRDTWTVSPAWHAGQLRSIECAQLLRSWGGIGLLSSCSGRANPMSNASAAIRKFRPFICAWTALEVAVGCRDVRAIKSALQQGRIDTSGTTLERLIEISEDPHIWGTEFSKDVCANTLGLVRRVLSPWSSQNHWLFNGEFRGAVKEVMLASLRLDSCGSNVVGFGVRCAEPPTLPGTSLVAPPPSPLPGINMGRLFFGGVPFVGLRGAGLLPSPSAALRCCFCSRKPFVDQRALFQHSRDKHGIAIDQQVIVKVHPQVTTSHSTLPPLPQLMWKLVCSFLVRDDWAAAGLSGLR